MLLLVLWVSSRGKFVFLDDVLYDRAEIAEPWRRYRKAGNSLFAFRLVAALIGIVAAIVVVGAGVWLAVGWGALEGLDGAALMLLYFGYIAWRVL